MDRPTDKLDNYMDLCNAVAALPGKQRRAALLYSLGYTQIEIAFEMGNSQPSVCRLLAKVKKNCQGGIKVSSLRVLSLVEAEI